MRRIFVSYSRDIEPTARAVVADMVALGCDVWFDQALSGGQAWWDQILQRIREADALIFLAAPASLNSTACASEIRYALQLGKTVVPVLVADGVSMGLLPPELARLQVVDHRTADKDAALRLARALTIIAPAPPLPEPLPAPPPAPTSYLSGLAVRVDSAESLSFEAQSSLVVELRHGLRDAAQREDSRAVLAKLRRRRDVYAAVAAEIDEALDSTAAGAVPATGSAESRRLDQPAARTHNQVDTPPQAPELPYAARPVEPGPRPVSGRLRAAGVCGGVAAVPSLLLTVMANASGPNLFIPPLLAAGGTAVAGALAGFDRRALLWVGGFAVLGLIGYFYFFSDGGSKNRMLEAIAFGISGGALVGAAIAIVRRRFARHSARTKPSVA